jgi:hypothetical protein
MPEIGTSGWMSENGKRSVAKWPRGNDVSFLGRSGSGAGGRARCMQPSPNGRRVGIRIVTFEACSSFTYVTARRIAQSPKATFVTRLQPCQLPSQAAHQLPDQSTILRVEPLMIRAFGAHGQYATSHQRKYPRKRVQQTKFFVIT